MGHMGGAEARARFVAVAGATALAVFVLLGLCAIPSAAQARADRALARKGVVTSEAERDAMTAARTTAIDGRLVRSHLIWSVVPGATPPLGVASLPGPGESLVSPALAAALETHEGAASRALFGVVVGQIGGDGLVDSGELLAYVGIEPPAAAFTLPVTGPVEHHPVTYRPGPGRTPEGIGAWGWVMVGLLVVSVPLHALVVAALRLGDRAQRRQLAALRLIGASRRDVRLIRAGALGPPALLGVGIAWIGFELARTRADRIGLAGRRWYPEDVEPSVAGVLAMVVVLAVVFVVVRRMVDETVDAPWQARRGWRPIGAPRLRAAPLALATALFVAQAVLGSGSYVVDSLRIDAGRLALHVLALLLATIGFAMAGPSLIRVISDRIAQRAEGPAVHVAARLAGADPVSVGRWSAVLATVVLLGGLAIAMGETTTDGARYWRGMPRGTMAIEHVTSVDLVDALTAEVGEDDVAAGWLLMGEGLGSPDVLVADCAALERVDPDLRGCGPPGRSLAWGDGSTEPITLTIDGVEVMVPGTSGSLTDGDPDVDHLGGMTVDVVADREGVDLDLAAIPPTVVFVRDRDARDRAAVLRVLGAVDPMASVESGPTVVDRYRSVHPIDDRAAQAFLVALGLVAMAGMVVALVDRGLAAARSDLGLVALGVRRRGRRRVVFLAAVLPVLVLVPLIGALSVAAEVSWARVLFRPVTLSGVSVALCAAVLAVTLVVALGLAFTLSSRATEGAWRRE